MDPWREELRRRVRRGGMRCRGPNAPEADTLAADRDNELRSYLHRHRDRYSGDGAEPARKL